MNTMSKKVLKLYLIGALFLLSCDNSEKKYSASDIRDTSLTTIREIPNEISSGPIESKRKWMEISLGLTPMPKEYNDFEIRIWEEYRSGSGILITLIDSGKL